MDYKEATIKLAYPVPLKGIVYDVYDGDTMKIRVEHEFLGPINMTIRFKNIDTSEIRRGPKSTPESLADAKVQRDFVRSLVLNQEVVVRPVSIGKFGRIVAYVYPPEHKWREIEPDYDNKLKLIGGYPTMELNEYMIREGRAKPSYYSR